MLDFITPEMANTLASISLGVGSVLVTALLAKAAQSKQLAKIRENYPIFDVLVAVAGNYVVGTRAETAYAIASQVLQANPDVKNSDVQKLAKQLVANYGVDAALGLDIAKLDSRDMAIGETIATNIIPNYRQGVVSAIAEGVSPYELDATPEVGAVS